MAAEGMPDAQRVLATARGVLGVALLIAAASAATVYTNVFRAFGLTPSPDTRPANE